jgi:hypothetical protein
MPKQAFSKKLKKGRKSGTWGSTHAIKWRDVQDVYALSTVHDDEVTEVQSLRGEHKKNKANYSG